MRWTDAFTSEYMKSYYVHQVVHHCPALWTWVLKHGLSFGMLSTSAIELRHLTYGRPAHKRSMRGGGGGCKRKVLTSEGEWTGSYESAKSLCSKITCNPVSYLVLMELLLLDWSMTNPLCTDDVLPSSFFVWLMFPSLSLTPNAP